MGDHIDSGGLVSPPAEITPLDPRYIRVQITGDIGNSGYSGDIKENIESTGKETRRDE